MKNVVFVYRGLKADPYSIVRKKAAELFSLKKKPQIAFFDGGKPYFKDYPHIHFNLSHSGDYLAVAFAVCPVGVDIEAHRPINLKIAERYFTQGEKAYVKNNISFFYVWTRKEAYLKKTGIGLKGINSCDALKSPNTQTHEGEGFTLSVCCDSQEAFELIYEENFQWQA